MNNSNNSLEFAYNWFIINDNVYVTNYKLSLNEIVRFLNYTNPGLVSEHNLKIVNKLDEKIYKVKSLDKIEFVTIVGGG